MVKRHRSRRATPPASSAWPHLALTTIAAVWALAIAPTFDLGAWTAAGAVVLVGFLSKVIRHAPERYRRHGWGEIQQMHDHRMGRFGLSDPDDRVGLEPAAPAAGRNDPCPCGSGQKYKHCCAAAPPE
jgi:hypothetical protein